jgi:hypothetical protein
MSHKSVARIDQLGAEARDIIDRLLKVVAGYRADGKDDSEVFADLGHHAVEARYYSSQFDDEDNADIAYLQLLVYTLMRLEVAEREADQ